MSQIAIDLPDEVAATLDWATLQAEKDSFLDPQLAQHPADLLYAVNLRRGGSKRQLYNSSRAL